MEATILHADLDAFFASVEQRDDPSLRGRPVIVGGGVVMAASYEARARGVRGAMGGAQARRLCPDAVVVPPRMTAYIEASKDVLAVFRETTPLVEPISVDEAFLDARGLRRVCGTPTEIAAGLRRRVRDEVGLPITVGVATTKHLAKVASAAAKPDGLLVVEPGREREFLDPLPIERLWGVGPATTRKLNDRGITRVRQLAELGEEPLIEILGRHGGRHLHAIAHNRDPRPVRAGRGRKSLGSQSALGRSPKSPEAIDATLLGVIERVTRRMRRSGWIGRTVVLRLRFGDYKRVTRSRTLPYATAETATIVTAARGLMAAAMPMIERRGLTLVGLALTNLEHGDAVQLSLPLDYDRHSALDAAIDDVRERFGASAITRAVLLGHQGEPRSLADAS